MGAFTESVVEVAAMDWLAGLGYTILHRPDIAVGEPHSERSDPGYRDVIRERQWPCPSVRPQRERLGSAVVNVEEA